MSILKYALAATTGLALLATAGAATAAPFTFNPSLSNPALSNGGFFTADDIIFSQYSSINIANNGSFTESGVLRVANFQFNGAPLLPNGYNSTGSATAYSLYITFIGTGTSSGANPGATGVFTTLTANLYGDLGNNNGALVVNQSGATFANGTAGDPLLATGALQSGTVSLGQNPNPLGSSPVLPSAFVLVNFTDTQPGAGGFFVNPSTLQFNLNSSFTNSDSVTTLVTTTTGIDLQVRGGGGNGTITAIASPVPEPMSLALLGAGLAAVGLVRRRRA